jgi:hypothetical protein
VRERRKEVAIFVSQKPREGTRAGAGARVQEFKNHRFCYNAYRRLAAHLRNRKKVHKFGLSNENILNFIELGI